jgi:putative tryptophan/tyrosine transport system substrate-binding protein
MRRREIITLLGGAAAGWPLSALGQPAGTRRVGVLPAFDESDPRPQAWLTAFTQGLAELSWTTGRNLQTDIRWAGNDVDLMRKFAKELVASKTERDPGFRNSRHGGIAAGNADHPDRICHRV